MAGQMVPDGGSTGGSQGGGVPRVVRVPLRHARRLHMVLTDPGTPRWVHRGPSLPDPPPTASTKHAGIDTPRPRWDYSHPATFLACDEVRRAMYDGEQWWRVTSSQGARDRVPTVYNTVTHVTAWSITFASWRTRYGTRSLAP